MSLQYNSFANADLSNDPLFGDHVYRETDGDLVRYYPFGKPGTGADADAVVIQVAFPPADDVEAALRLDMKTEGERVRSLTANGSVHRDAVFDRDVPWGGWHEVPDVTARVWEPLPVDATIPTVLLDEAEQKARWLAEAMEFLPTTLDESDPDPVAVFGSLVSCLLPSLLVDLVTMCHGLTVEQQERLVFLSTCVPVDGVSGDLATQTLRGLTLWYLSEYAPTGDGWYPAAYLPDETLPEADPFLFWTHEDGTVLTHVVADLYDKFNLDRIRTVTLGQVAQGLGFDEAVDGTNWIALLSEEYVAWLSSAQDRLYGFPRAVRGPVAKDHQ